MSIKSCARCGKKFTCSADKDCWCESFQIHRKEMIVIMDEYKDCLCPECLEEFAEK